jgi:hypothetical protein
VYIGVHARKVNHAETGGLCAGLSRRNARGENLKAAVSLHFGHYNFVRLHCSLRNTPAIAAGVSDKLWTLEELIEHTSR